MTEEQDFLYIPTEALLKQVGSVYKLVILAARRAIELNNGGHKLVDMGPKAKASTVALEEIKEGKIGYKKSKADK